MSESFCCVGVQAAESAVVEDVRLIGAAGTIGFQRASFKLRYQRNPVIGDKFSSRCVRSVPRI